MRMGVGLQSVFPLLAMLRILPTRLMGGDIEVGDVSKGLAADLCLLGSGFGICGSCIAIV